MTTPKDFSFNDLEQWLDQRRVTEVECLVPDLTGVARGKILPRQKFTEDRGMRLPEGGEWKTVCMLAAKDEKQTVLTATENGYGKRTLIEDFPTKGRGNKGVITGGGACSPWPDQHRRACSTPPPPPVA